MTEASEYIIGVAGELAAIYTPHTSPRAIIVTGSVAEGSSDTYSDLDFGLYYDELPSEETIDAAQQEIGGENVRRIGDRDQGAFLVFFRYRGIECQVMFVTVASVEAEMATVLEQLDVMTPSQKALEGMLKCVPLAGDDLVQRWKDRAANYPDALARAMVQKGLEIFPIWRLSDYLAPRDATIWINENLVEGSYSILRMLAGLNRVYFSSFQFKRMHKFVAKLKIAPPNLADRLEHLFHTDNATALDELDGLVQETVALVEQHMPDIDTAKLKNSLGSRVSQWKMAGTG